MTLSQIGAAYALAGRADKARAMLPGSGIHPDGGQSIRSEGTRAYRTSCAASGFLNKSRPMVLDPPKASGALRI